MKVKTYKNQSLQEGLEDIKRDLGSDALILSTRSVSERPKFGLFKKQAWEITAALEERGLKAAATDETQNAGRSSTPASLNLNGAVTRPREGRREKAVAPVTAPSISPTVPLAAAAAAAVAPARDPRMDELIGEISDLKKSFRSLSKAMPGKTEFGGGLYAELLSQGIDADFADHLISTASRGNPAPSEMRDTRSPVAR